MSSITFINQTQEMVRLAIFQKPAFNPTLATFAWQVVSPPPGGSSTVTIPPDYSLKVRYSSNPSDPSHLDTSANPVAFSEITASFSIDSVSSQDGKASGVVVNQRFGDLVLNEVRVINNFGIGVEASVCRGENPIFAPVVVWPGGLFMEDIRGNLSVAVVSQFVGSNQPLVEEEISLTQIGVVEGDSIVVTGSQWTGYALAKA